MHFDLVKPCDNCPFRKDIAGYLTTGRVDEIDKALIRSTFACHKTTVESEDGEYLVATSDSQHCAGALILLEKIDRRGDMQQIAQRLGLYDPSRLDMASPVFDSFAEMRKAQVKGTRRRRRASKPT